MGSIPAEGSEIFFREFHRVHVHIIYFIALSGWLIRSTNHTTGHNCVSFNFKSSSFNILKSWYIICCNLVTRLSNSGAVDRPLSFLLSPMTTEVTAGTAQVVLECFVRPVVERGRYDNESNSTLIQSS